MKKSNLALTLLMAFGITACGSSGGGEAPKVNVPKFEKPTAEQPANKENSATTTSTEEPTKVVPPTTTSSKEKPQTPTAYTEKNELVAGAFIIPKDAGNVKTASVKNGKKTDFNFLNVEGRHLEIIPTTGISSKVIEMDSNNIKRFGSKGNYTVAGFVWEEGLYDQYLIAMGFDATKEKDMPVNGKITYTGHGASLYPSKGNNTTDIVTLTDVNLVADFDNKTLSGTIKSSNDNSKFVPVDISADITKNTFYGNVNNVEVQGGFFGPQAAEIAGDYIRTGNGTQSSIGAFQAEKQ